MDNTACIQSSKHHGSDNHHRKSTDILHQPKHEVDNKASIQSSKHHGSDNYHRKSTDIHHQPKHEEENRVSSKYALEHIRGSGNINSNDSVDSTIAIQKEIESLLVRLIKLFP